MKYSQRKIKRVVVDTNVLVSALLVRGSVPTQVVESVIENDVLLISQESLSELKKILNRKKFDKYVSKEIRLKFIENIEANARSVKFGEVPSICRDSDDDILLATANTGDADYLVTGDDDLLVLKNYELVQMVTPKDFLEMM